MSEHEARRGALLRIYIGEADRHAGRPLHQWLLQAAHEAGLAGATVLRGLEGYGASRHLHQASILRLAEDLPLVVEFVDEEARLRAFLPRLAGAVKGPVTLERVELHGPAAAPPEA
jgi:PII-like signaling protein